MSELKRLHAEAIEHAMEKARHYRLLNQPAQAESICLDVLEIQPENQDALIVLILARTDQLKDANPATLQHAQEVLPRLKSDYHREYYAALICERQAMCFLKRRGTRSSLVAYQWFGDAMKLYEKAMTHQPPDDDEALLRWNFCTRMIDRHRLRDLDPEELQNLGIE